MKKILDNLKIKSAQNAAYLKKKVLIIQIDPDKIKAEIKKIELFGGYVATFMLIIGILVISFNTKANVSTFYASNCLGGWENPKYAENIPDVKDNSRTTDFSPENSAVLNNVSAQIFCGDYKGNIPEDALAKRFVVKFSILGSSTILPSHEPFPGVDNALKGVVETTNSDNFSESLNSALENIGPAIESLPDIEKEEIIPEIKREENKEEVVPETKEITPIENIPVEIIPSIETPSEPVSFLLNLFSKFALAQEVTQEIIPAATPEPVSAIEIVPELAPEIILEPVVENKEKEKKEIKEEIIEETIEEMPTQEVEETEEIKEVQPTENNFSNNWLEVMYTLDGKEWKSLGYINSQNISNPEFEIPFAEITWENLSKIQISISSVLSIDIPPIIYLDSVWIETEYEEMSDAELLEKKIPEEQPVLPLSVKLGANPDKSIRAELYMDDVVLVPLTEKIKKKSYYYIFSVLDRNANGSYCAKFTGRIWITGEPPFTYGTCFSNDTGEFEIIETSEDIFWNYTDFDIFPEKVLSRKVFSIPTNLSTELLAE